MRYINFGDEPLTISPDEFFMNEALKEARLATEGAFYRRQLSFGMMDLALHTQIHDSNQQETLPLSNKVLSDVFLPVPENTAFVAPRALNAPIF